MYKSAIALAIAGMLLQAPALADQHETAVVPDPVAVVNGTPISKATYEAYTRQRQASGQALEGAEAQQALTQEIVIQELLVQQAEKDGLDKNAEFEQQMDLVRRNLLATGALRQLVQSKPITEEAIAAEYEAVKGSLGGTEYSARHILVDAEQAARDLIGKLQEGADFAELATANSTDGSAANGGDLGWFSPEMMVKPFADAVVALEPGKFGTDPVQTQFGWHVIKLEETRETAPPPIDALRPQIQQKLQAEMINGYIDTLREAASIEFK